MQEVPVHALRIFEFRFETDKAVLPSLIENETELVTKLDQQNQTNKNASKQLLRSRSRNSLSRNQKLVTSAKSECLGPILEAKARAIDQVKTQR